MSENQDVDKWKSFLLKCLFNSEKEKPKLFVKVCFWIHSNHDENITSSERDWEIMLCLLYTHIYKVECGKLKIYRFGVFVCDYNDKITLKDQAEKRELEKVLHLLRQKIVRSIVAIKEMILKIFTTAQTINNPFKVVDDDEDTIMRMKDLISKHDYSASMVNLRNEVKKGKAGKIILMVCFVNITTT
jgi:hypothetical protein